MAECKYYKPYFDTLRKIIGEYYQLEGCCSGGPLHVLLDDDNYNIRSVRWCLKDCFEGLAAGKDGYYSETIYILGIMICNEYAHMSLEERAAFDSYMNGDPLDCRGYLSVSHDCEKCRIFDNESYEFMKEMEKEDASN